jgi:hypothetical protein
MSTTAGGCRPTGWSPAEGPGEKNASIHSPPFRALQARLLTHQQPQHGQTRENVVLKLIWRFQLSPRRPICVRGYPPFMAMLRQPQPGQLDWPTYQTSRWGPCSRPVPHSFHLPQQSPNHRNSILVYTCLAVPQGFEQDQTNASHPWRSRSQPTVDALLI